MLKTPRKIEMWSVSSAVFEEILRVLLRLSFFVLPFYEEILAVKV